MTVYTLNENQVEFVDAIVTSIFECENFLINITFTDYGGKLNVSIKSMENTGRRIVLDYELKTISDTYCLSDECDYYRLLHNVASILFDSDEEQYIYPSLDDEPLVIIDPDHGDPLLSN